MYEEEKDETVESSPTGEETASPAEPTQETETPTPQEGETQEKPVVEEQAPLHEHPRFKEVIDEKNYWRQQAEALANKPTPQQPTPQADPYAGLSAEEKLFYQNQETMMRKVAKEEQEKANKQTQSQLQAAQREFVQIKTSEFRRAHPDIKKESSEEYAIAQKIQQGYNPDDAYWSVMGPKGVQQAQQTATRKVKQEIQAKKKANVESSPSVQSSGLPRPKQSFRETLSERMNNEWDGSL